MPVGERQSLSAFRTFEKFRALLDLSAQNSAMRNKVHDHR